MTEQEAIEVLKEIVDEIAEDDGICYVTDCNKEPLEMAIKALEKQIPKKPKYLPLKNGIMTTNYECPICGCRRLGHGNDLDKCYCPECGQCLNWEEV